MVPSFMLAAAWYGVAGVFAGAAALFSILPEEMGWIPFGFFAVACVTAAIGLYSLLVGTPRWLQPRWYRAESAR